MSSSFDDGLRFVLRAEGGRSDDPRDPGGRTAFGITQTAYREWKKDPGADVFAITEEEVRAIYRERYWDVAHCDELPWAVALCHFDSAVLHGPGNAAVFLADATWADVEPKPQAYAYLSLRRRFIKKIGNPTFQRGWLARVDALRKEIGL